MVTTLKYSAENTGLSIRDLLDFLYRLESKAAIESLSYLYLKLGEESLQKRLSDGVLNQQPLNIFRSILLSHFYFIVNFKCSNVAKLNIKKAKILTFNK